MASTPSTIGNVEQIGIGEQLSTWGISLNACIDRLTEMAVGVTSVSLPGNKTLTTTNYVANESRWGGIRFTDGGLSSAPTVTFPAETRSWLVINTGSTYAVNCLAAGSGVSAVSVAAGKWAIIDCDGTDMFIRDLSNMGGDLALSSIADIASSRVIGNMSGSTAAPSLITVYDEDNMASNSATGLATQQSIKAYTDAKTAAVVSDAGAAAAASAAAAATSASNASTSETNAASSASAASTSATNAASSATAAASSATAAASSATDAANSAASAASKIEGPASATDNALVQFDGTSGKLAKNGPSIGASANNLVQLDGSARLPAVDGSQLTNLTVSVSWVSLSSTVISGSPSSVEFTGIDQTYSELLFVFEAVSHDSGGGISMRIYVSGDSGSTYSTGYPISPSVDGTATIYGGVSIPNYTDDSGVVNAAPVNLTSDQTITVGSGNSLGWRVSGGIDAIKFAFPGALLDGGTITMYGR